MATAYSTSRRSISNPSSSKILGIGTSDLQESALDELLGPGDDESLMAQIENFRRLFEEHLFGLLYLMTKDRKKLFNNRTANMALLFFDFFQFMFFIFSGDFPWYHRINVLQRLFEAFQLTAGAIPEAVFVPLFLLICIVMLTMVGLAAYVAKEAKKSHVQEVNLVIALRTMVAVFITLGYIPFLKVAIVPMDCTFKDGTAIMDAFPDIECFTGLHILIFAISLTVFITFVPFALIMSLVYFDSHPKSPNFLSRSTNRVDFLYTVSRTIVVLFSTFLTRNLGVRVATVFLANAVMLVAYLKYPPYHRMQPTCLRIAFFSTGLVSSTFAVIIVAIDDPNNWAIVTILGIVIIPVFFGSYFAAKKYLERLFSSAMMGSNHHHSTSMKFKSPFLVEYATRKYLRAKEDIELTNTEIDHVKTMYVKGMSQFKDSAALRVQYALFLIAYVPSAAATEVRLLIVEMAKLRNVPFDIRFLIFNLRWVWQQDLETRGIGKRGGMDLIDYINFKRTFAVAKHFHQEARKSLFNFWKLLLRQNASLVQLETQAEEFERMEQISLTAYEKLLVKYFNSKDLLRSYGGFWLDIYRDKSISNECFAMADEIEEYENRKSEQHKKTEGVSDSSADEKDPSAGDATNKKETQSDEEEVKSRVKSENTSSSGRERERLKRMKARLDKIRKQGNSYESSAVRRFTMLLFALQLFLFAIPITGIVIFNEMYSAIRLNTKQLQKMHDQVFHIESLLYMVHSFEILSMSNEVPNSKYYNCSQTSSCQNTVSVLKTATSAKADELHAVQTNMFYLITRSQKYVADFWIYPANRYDVFFGPPITKERKPFSLLDLGDFFVERTEVISGEGVDVFKEWSNDVSYRFCIDNGPEIVTQAYLRGAELHLDYEEDIVDEFTFTFTTMVIVAAVVIFMIAVVWAPIYRVVVSEISALEYLKSLTKPDVQEMCTLYRFVEKNDEEDNSAFRGEQARKVNERAKFNRNIFIILLCLAMCGIIIMIYIGVYASRTPVVLTDKAAKRASYGHLSNHLIRHIFATHGNITYESQQEALDVLERMRQAHEDIVRAASGDQEQESWLFNKCAGMNYGVYTNMASFMAKQRELIFLAAALPFEERIKTVAQVYALTEIGDPFIDCLMENRNLYQGRAEDEQSKTFVGINAFFWIVWPIFFVSTTYAIPMGFRRQVLSASIRSRRMLTMLPNEMIQRNSEINEYMIGKGLVEGSVEEEEKTLDKKRSAHRMNSKLSKENRGFNGKNSKDDDDESGDEGRSGEDDFSGHSESKDSSTPRRKKRSDSSTESDSDGSSNKTSSKSSSSSSSSDSENSSEKRDRKSRKRKSKAKKTAAKRHASDSSSEDEKCKGRQHDPPQKQKRSTTGVENESATHALERPSPKIGSKTKSLSQGKDQFPKVEGRRSSPQDLVRGPATLESDIDQEDEKHHSKEKGKEKGRTTNSSTSINPDQGRKSDRQKRIAYKESIHHRDTDDDHHHSNRVADRNHQRQKDDQPSWSQRLFSWGASLQSDSLQKKGSQRNSDRLFREALCSKCAKRDRNALFVPCGHLMYCTHCARELSRCPHCEAKIRSVERVSLH